MLYLLVAANPSLLDTAPLDKDPTYKKVISRRVTYPPVSDQHKIALMVYARFTINERGHVEHVKIIRHPTEEVHHKFYDAVVESALKRLPPLNPSYVGHYILPVSFSLRDEHNGQLLIPEDVGYYGEQVNSVMLQPVKVIGYRRYRVQN
ncbi:hypothetical protein [Fibrella aestuarina]|uniref:hypothetical protein n=1 Tax=Fibrella aestuarina TaxID=651143 RepID=UPI00130E1023|nr:hypothetical protein [Fibrella aestuarina]